MSALLRIWKLAASSRLTRSFAPTAFRCADSTPAQQLAKVADDARSEIVTLLDYIQLSLVLVLNLVHLAVGNAQTLCFDWPTLLRLAPSDVKPAQITERFLKIMFLTFLSLSHNRPT